MFVVNAQKSNVLLPQDLLRKAGETYYPHIEFRVNCEPYSIAGEPYWAFDNYRCGGRIEGAPSHIFYTQPSWGMHFAERYPRDTIKCVTYACDPELHKAIDVEKEYDVGFIGTFMDGDGRKDVMDAIQKEFKCLVSSSTPSDQISTVLSKCKVLFNHIRYEEVNIRFFEALAIGAQVCTYTPNLNLFATEGESYLTFKSIPEAITKIRLLLNDEPRRMKMAGNARRSALNNTYRHRAHDMLAFLNLI
jgi:hypothetical protein